jgi:hypothetical protein
MLKDVFALLSVLTVAGAWYLAHRPTPAIDSRIPAGGPAPPLPVPIEVRPGVVRR